MAIGKKTGGRRKGTPNKATAERQAAVAALGKTPLEIMIENARWADNQVNGLMERLVVSEPSLATEELFSQMIRLRQLSVEWAHLAAPYVHPRLAAIAHGHTNADGSPLMPIVTITIEGDAQPAALEEAGPGVSDVHH
jgi:hypothetical protein